MIVLRSVSLLAILGSLLAECTASPHHSQPHSHSYEKRTEEYDYVVIGSGAGGGPVAARLAINGFKVLMLEAGDDQGLTPQQSIPAFYPASSEFAPMSWDFFVRHYSDEARDKANSKATWETPEGETYVGLYPPEGSTFKGIWYPRAGTLGGCAAHNALVAVYPHEKDWTSLQNLTGDDSWSPTNMRKYFERIEKNEYLTANGNEASGHGFSGWLPTDQMDTELMAADPQMMAVLSADASVQNGTTYNLTSVSDLRSLFPRDMNTDYPDRDTADGFYDIPLAMSDGARKSPRDFLLATAANSSYDLTIKLNSHVTKVTFDTSNPSSPRATGVDYLTGIHLYQASPLSSETARDTAVSNHVKASKEVIVAGGTFNTPQILKLSGIGPKEELEALSIPVIADLPGVGLNLQDHLEISTIVKFANDFSFAANCTFLSTLDDPCYIEYAAASPAISPLTGKAQRGPYASNLLPAAILRTSSLATERDTFIFGGPVNFKGYFQGYTDLAIADAQHWSWLALKAHVGNHAGTVLLNSTDPLVPPTINFHYFDDGTPGSEDGDLTPMLEAVKFQRQGYAAIPSPYRNFTEVFPGANVTSDAAIKDFIRRETWGHHATGTAKMGVLADDPYAVVDGNFSVHGVTGLRVVDASVFPEVPGFFPVMSTYMIAEKAADVITEAGKSA